LQSARSSITRRLAPAGLSPRRMDCRVKLGKSGACPRTGKASTIPLSLYGIMQIGYNPLAQKR